jgi:hypothetical protein
MPTILIGLDDTDTATSRGTGHLARQLAAECVRRGMTALGVTRHQFLVDPRIPYTSHNSGACVAVACEEGVAAAEFALEFVASRAAEGSDPGICIAEAAAVPEAIIALSCDAARRIIEKDEALRAAAEAGLLLRPLGSTGLGVIGALASVGRRAEGNEGRFIDLPGLRDLPERVRAEDLTRLGVILQYPAQGPCPRAEDAYDTLGWVRPRLVRGRPVLPLEWSEATHAWRPVDRKHARP